MVAEYPQLGRDGLIDLPWSPPKLDAKAQGPIRYPIADFFLTNAICRNSPTMQRCSEELVQGCSSRRRRSEGCATASPAGEDARAARAGGGVRTRVIAHPPIAAQVPLPRRRGAMTAFFTRTA